MDKISTKQNVIKSRRPFEHLMKIKTEGNNLGILKTIVIAILLLTQIAFVVLNGIFVLSFIKWYTYFALFMSLCSIIYAISSNKNSQSKAVWILFLVVFFEFGYIVFWLSDEKVFFRRQKKKYDKIFERSYAFQQDSAKVLDATPSFKSDVNFLKNSGNFSCYTGTDAQYYSSGSKLFDEVLHEISLAKKFIFIEYFIISDGVLLKRLENILKTKCESGVDVRIIYDDMGSHRTFSYRTRKRLRNMGVKIKKFNQLISVFSVGLNYRDHRKIVVIDGKVGFTGGANFADEYTNLKRMHGYWKDAGIKLVGPAVDGMTLTFLRQWEYVSKEIVEFSPYLNLAEKSNNTSIFIPYADGLDYEKNIGKDAYINLISGAQKKLYIMTPYFVIDDIVFNLLKNKALSGVDVRFIIPDIPDKKIVYRVSRNNAEKLMLYGVKVYVMNKSFVHSKIAFNENEVIVGSINFDLRSFYQQFENAVLTNDKKVREAVEDDFEKTIKISTKITRENMSRRKTTKRIVAGVLGIVSPLM